MEIEIYPLQDEFGHTFYVAFVSCDGVRLAQTPIMGTIEAAFAAGLELVRPYVKEAEEEHVI